MHISNTKTSEPRRTYIEGHTETPIPSSIARGNTHRTTGNTLSTHNQPFFSPKQSASNDSTSTLGKGKMYSSIQVASFNCKNIKTCGNSIDEMLKYSNIILIQEHWLFHSQISIISEVNSNINFAAKGVDMNDPLPPVCLPRGYGGVAILWNKNIDHIVRPIPDGSHRIQCIEIEGAETRAIIICVYMPANGSRDHHIEYHECVDELREIVLKYERTHNIIIGGDINEDLNKSKANNTRKAYLTEFIKDFNLVYENSGYTFTNSRGVECSEIDYFLHKIPLEKIVKTKSILHIISNTSDHHPIHMAMRWDFDKSKFNSREKLNRTN